MSNFYAVFDLDQIEEEFVIAGVFSKIEDAQAFSSGLKVRSVHQMTMAEILSTMLQSRLRLASDKIAKLIGE